MYFKDFLEKKGKPVINNNPGCTDSSKLQEFQDEGFCQEIEHKFVEWL